MIYKINRTQFNNLGGNKEEVLDHLNANLAHPNIKQTHVDAIDRKTGEVQRIKTEPIRIITDLIITN